MQHHNAPLRQGAIKHPSNTIMSMTVRVSHFQSLTALPDVGTYLRPGVTLDVNSPGAIQTG